MSPLKDLLLYLCTRYPLPHELSKARLTKMVYLADWRSAITRGEQITPIQWEYNHFGPYVRDVEQLARRDADFRLDPTTTAFGDFKEVIGVKPGAPDPELDAPEREIADFVIDQTRRMYWNDFIALVYSTYPIRTQSQYSMLDLVSLAREYQAERDALPA